MEPLENDIYSLLGSDEPGNNCDFGRNVFTNIDPDNDGVPGIEYNDSIIIRVGCCLPSIPDSIEKWIDIYTDLGGDDPRTQEDDSRTNQQGQTSSGNSSGSSTSSNSSNNNMSLSVAKSKMVNWIDFGVYVSLQNNDRALGESILNNLQAWKYRKMLFGLLVKHRDLIAAQSILSQLPTRNEEESHFKIIQSINMKRLNGLSESNKINETDISMLVVLANSTNPSRGYARSVYHSLTGHSLPMVFPSRISGRSTEGKTYKSSGVLIYPNPFQNQLTISSEFDILSYRILNLDGKLINNGSTSSKELLINTVGFDEGMYIIELSLADGSKISKLINKT